MVHSFHSWTEKGSSVSPRNWINTSTGCNRSSYFLCWSTDSIGDDHCWAQDSQAALNKAWDFPFPPSLSTFLYSLSHIWKNILLLICRLRDCVQCRPGKGLHVKEQIKSLFYGLGTALLRVHSPCLLYYQLVHVKQMSSLATIISDSLGP